MSPRIPVVSGKQTAQALCKAGFKVVRQKGSHIILRRDEPFAQVTVPNHKTLDRGTLRSIIKYAGLSMNEFLHLISS